MQNKFNYGCFIPPASLVFKILSIVLMIFGLSYLGVWDYLGSISHIFKEILHYGIFVFVGIYLIYYEANFLTTFRELTSGVRVIIQEKIEEYDKGVDEHLLDDVDEQITCLSKFLQFLLLKIRIPETKVKKITVKKVSGTIIKWLLVYPIVFIIIVFWDLFFRTILPFAWNKIKGIILFLYSFIRLDILVIYIVNSTFYKNVIEEIKFYNLKNVLLVISFSSLFALMEVMGAYSLILFAGGSFIFGLAMYAAKFAVFMPIHAFHNSKARDMRTVSWFKKREEDIFLLFAWFEKLNVYTRVMGVLKKLKAIFNTIVLQVKNLFNAIKALLVYYYKTSMNNMRSIFGLKPEKNEIFSETDIIDEIKLEHDSLWTDVLNNFKLFFEGFSDILTKESNCLDLKNKAIEAYDKLKTADINDEKKSLGDLTAAFNKAQKKYNDCFDKIKKDIS